MPKGIEEITKEAMDLAPRQRIALAEFLLESAEAAADPEAEAAWDSEIRDRIRAIDEGRVTGVAYEDVMREVERRRAPYYNGQCSRIFDKVFQGALFFPLSPRRRSGERTEERGCVNAKREKFPPLPGPPPSDGGEGVVAAVPRCDHPLC